jgi:flagellar basal-body rod protein FlgB
VRRESSSGTGLAHYPVIVNDITDSAVIGDLARRMNLAVARESIAASNLANLDTPGFRSLDASFADVLDGQLTPVVTAKGHQRMSGGAAAAGTSETPGLPSRRDGNNVQLDRELVAMNRAAADFSAAQTALSAKFRLVRYAINEGR